MLFVKIALIMALLSICYQDIRERLIYLFLFPICAMCFAFLSYNTIGVSFFKDHLPVNVLMIFIMITTVRVLYKIKYGERLSEEVIGMGDYFMLFVICFAFGTSAFIMFSLASLISALVVYVVIKKLRLQEHPNKKASMAEIANIPLAGYMAIFFALLFSAQWLVGITSFYN